MAGNQNGASNEALKEEAASRRKGSDAPTTDFPAAEGQKEHTLPENEIEEQIHDTGSGTTGGTTGTQGMEKKQDTPEDIVFTKWAERICERKEELDVYRDESRKLSGAGKYSFKPFAEDKIEPTISLGLLNREFGEKSPRLPNRKEDLLKLDVAFEFLHIDPFLKEKGWPWKQACERVVCNPTRMRQVYNVPLLPIIRPVWKDSPIYESDAEIQCVLTLDSIFLACFLMIHLDVYPWMLGEVEKIFSKQPRAIFSKLSLHILDLRNQIPLNLIRNVYKILVQMHLRTIPVGNDDQRLVLDEQTDLFDTGANFIVSRVCTEFVASNSFPTFRMPQFYGTKVVRDITVEVKGQSYTKFYAVKCRHLLHCQMEAIWASAFPATYKIEERTHKQRQSDNKMEFEKRAMLLRSKSPDKDSEHTFRVNHKDAEKFLACKVYEWMDEIHMKQTPEMEEPREEPQPPEEKKQKDLLCEWKPELLKKLHKHQHEAGHHPGHWGEVKDIVGAMKDDMWADSGGDCRCFGIFPAKRRIFKRHSKFLFLELIYIVGELVGHIFGILLGLIRGLIGKLLGHRSDSDDEAKSTAIKMTDRTSALPTASELAKYGIDIQGQDVIFPRFKRRKFRFWRATLFLPTIKFLGKNTKTRWRTLMEFEDTWTECTGIWEDICDHFHNRPAETTRLSATPRNAIARTLLSESSIASPRARLQRAKALRQKPESFWELEMMRKSLNKKKKKSSHGTTNKNADGAGAVPQEEDPNQDYTPTKRRKPFLSYLLMMDELVNTEDDVGLLITGPSPVILASNLGDHKDVADFFNEVLDGCVVSRLNDSEWMQLKTKVRKFHNRRYRRLWVEFLDTNFGKPWIVVSILVAFTLLVATALQTYYAMKEYYLQW